MWKKVDACFAHMHKELSGNVLIIGLSGGADSIALTEYLLYRREIDGFSLHAVHVNHNIRGEEALRDEVFVKEYCEKKGISLDLFSLDVKAYAKEAHLSEEEAGRILRYRCFAQTKKALEEEGREERKVAYIALAHHMDDLAETMLFRMARGTGPEGLIAMTEYGMQDQMVLLRPLLSLRKKEILSILKALGQPYVTDSTNEEETYHRNFIRRQILPNLELVNEKAVEHLSALSGQMEEMMAYLTPKMDALFAENLVLFDVDHRICQADGTQETCQEEKTDLMHGAICTAFFRKADYEKLAPFEQKQLLRRMLYAVAGAKKDITALHVDLLEKVFSFEEGKRLDLPYDLLALREKEGIKLSRKAVFYQEKEDLSLQKERKRAALEETFSIDRELLEEGDYEVELGSPWMVMSEGKPLTALRLGMYIRPYEAELYGDDTFFKNEKRHCIGYFDYDKIKYSLTVRNRRAGDYFVMDQSGKKKTLRRYFIDRKLEASQRDSIPLLAVGEHVIWIPGDRISEAYKVSRDTKRVLITKIFTK